MRALMALLHIVLILAVGIGRILVEVVALFAGGPDRDEPKTQYDQRATWENNGYSWERWPDDLH